jgi:hypothetical protein
VARWIRNAHVENLATGLALSAEEGFVLSRLDAPLTRDEVVSLTGLPAERIDNILSFLEDKGFVTADTPSMRAPMATIPDADYLAAPTPAVMWPAETMAHLYERANLPEVPDAKRLATYDDIRNRFAAGAPEQRAAFIADTDGNGLVALRGMMIDSRTAAILCARHSASVGFVRAVAKFPGCPAVLLSHLARQPLVQRDSQLRSLLLRHPNMPGEAKRRG